MNFDEALVRHVEWKDRFLSAIASHAQLDESDIGCDNCCSLGIWLYGDGKQLYGNSSQYATLLAYHRQLHVEAGKIASLINQQHYLEAQRALEPGASYGIAVQAVRAAVITLRKLTE